MPMPASTAADLVTVGELRLSLVRLARRVRKRAATGMTPSQLSALSTIERHGSLRPGRLAEAEQINKSSVTRLVAHLEAGGLIVRTPDAEDARSSQVQLTAEGRRLMAESSHRADAYLARQIAALSPGEQRRLLAAAPVLQRLLEVKA
ncbi:MAG: MarR family transcriptional regulator [Micromonosporaceae bacterium]|nr:MarR family transcriptional regulator [Micromonosporaceae bacterium]